MLGLRFANYLNKNMEQRGWGNQHLQRVSSVSDSTISSYRKGLSKNPAKENMYLIAEAFGDPPSVIDELCAMSDTAAAEEEQRLLAEAADRARLERIVSMLREHMVQILNDFREQSAAQQTEIIQHADARVETERKRFKSRADEVLRQCNAENDKMRAICDGKIDMVDRHCKELLLFKDQQLASSKEEDSKVRTYLRIVIRNLSIALVAVSAFAIVGLACLGGYAFYAYQTFDVEDPTRGLFRGGASVGPIVLTLLVLLVVTVTALTVFLIIKKRRSKTAEE